MADDFELAARTRHAFADLIEGLDDAQLAGPTLAGHWTPRDVLGHVVYFVEMKMPRFMFHMAKAGFGYDKMADAQAQANAKRPVAELLQALRSGAHAKPPMPGFGEIVPVGDIAIHIQDVRRGQDLPGELDPEILKMALDFVSTHKIGMDLAEIPGQDSMRFHATDLDWSFGAGSKEVSGPGEAILMTLAGRPASAELTGFA